ncbi:hypothetical protein DRE_00842 [Drechslerella stenobrocha 248]|uniref:Peptidase S54 rhomboid domain-containing protein n=1 Tax=Drechslerella stenobrocha 248 TaxID=1043628 RepID=W7HZS5_9PEZI|nr:hypothetical protein DRE_00842 [Drechslerella stenobrocha 248]
MNVSLTLRLASRLASGRHACICVGAARPSAFLPLGTTAPSLSTLARRTWPTSILLPAQPQPTPLPLTLLRFASNHRSRTPRERKAPSLPAPVTPSIARPATLVGAEQEPIRYTDYARPAGSSSSSEPPPPPPISESQRATSRFVVIIGVTYAIIYLFSWAPQLSGFAHSSPDEPTSELFMKYVKPWHQWIDRWFTISPSTALQRLGFYGISRDPADSPLATITQFILPAFSHVTILHLAFNFFALQAFAPTLVRYYGLKRSLLAYLFIGSAGLLLLVPCDILLNPYVNLLPTTAMQRYRETDSKVIREQTRQLPTKAQTEEHFFLGQHCRPMLGGSGALYGMLAITAIVNPGAKFQLMFVPVDISVRTLFMALCAGDLTFLGLRSEAWGAIGHLTGALAGVMLWALWLRRVKLPTEVQRQLMMRLRRKRLGMSD